MYHSKTGAKMNTYSKKMAVEQFSKRSTAYVACSALMDQADLDTVVGLLDLTGVERVLDVATGTGNLAMAMSPHVKEVIGIDIRDFLICSGNAKTNYIVCEILK